MQTSADAILQETVEPVEIRDVVRIIFKRLWVLPVTTAVCVAAGVLTVLYWTPTYEAQVRMVVVGSPKVISSYYNENPAHEDFMAGTYAEIIKNHDVLRQVVLALHLENRDSKQFDSALKSGRSS
jgi:capsular polysaccharide biosynthesis protein